jgi:hypothetical protein
MTQQYIDTGNTANDGTGTPLRDAFDICNSNFTELYGIGGVTGIQNGNSNVQVLTNSTINISSRGTANVLERNFGGTWVALWQGCNLTFGPKPIVDVHICNSFIISRSFRLRIAANDAPKRGHDFVCSVRLVKLQCCGPYSAVNRARTSLPFI